MISLNVPSKTALFTILHFVVDALCALGMFTYAYQSGEQYLFLLFLHYNGIAFLGQPLIGLLIDRFPQPHLFLLIGVEFLLVAFLLKDFMIWPVVLLGIGNAFFHISGGKYVIEHTHNDIVSLGIFVSTGAIGIIVGQFFSNRSMMLGLLTALFVFTFMILLSKEERPVPVQEYITEKKSSLYFVLFLILAVVMIRSYIGKITVCEFDTTRFTFLGISIACCLGKIAGGLCAKYFGVFKTISWSMTIAIVMLCLFTKDYPCILIGVFFFNFSMPITLYLANRLLSKHHGLAFGLLAATLLPGYLLGMLNESITAAKWMIFLFSTASIFMVNISYRSIRNGLS